MAYETLYRKYRPRRFAEVVGQTPIVRALQNALASRRFAHAYLFCGQRGTGKTTLARLLAMALNCERGVAPEPCGTCLACTNIRKGAAMDVLEIDAASHTGVDAVREIIVERVSFLPATFRYKVYIIDEVHMLSQASFNALLKTLEEPPPRVVFILATTDPHKVPATVRSRCLRFDFRPLSPKEIVGRLEEVMKAEGWEGRYEASALWLIARAARGALRDALTILEQAMNFSEGSLTVELVRSLLGVTDDEFLRRITQALCDQDIPTLWRSVSEAVETGRDLPQLVHDLSLYLRDLLRFKMKALPETETESERWAMLQEQADLFEEEALIRMVRTAWELERDLRTAHDIQLAVEVGLMSLAQAARKEPIASKERSETAPVTAPAPKGETGIEHIRQHWNIVLQQVKRHSLITYTFLLDAEPTEFQDNRLVLTFRHPFSHDCLKEPHHRDLVEQVIQEVFQIPQLKIRPSLSKEAYQPSVGQRLNAASHPYPEESVSTEEALGSLFEE